MNLKTEKKYINEKTSFFNQQTYHWFYKYHNRKKTMTYVKVITQVSKIKPWLGL